MRARLHSCVAFTTVALAVCACSRDAPQPQPQPPSETRLAPASTAPTADKPRPRCAMNFSAFDDDADGRVSRAEFDSRPHVHADSAALFGSRDSDADGFLSEREFCSGWRGARRHPRGEGMAPRRRPSIGPGGRGASMRGARCEQHFDTFDANADGTLTKEEFAAWPHPRGDAETLFEARDRDSDGKLMRAEFCRVWK